MIALPRRVYALSVGVGVSLLTACGGATGNAPLGNSMPAQSPSPVTKSHYSIVESAADFHDLYAFCSKGRYCRDGDWPNGPVTLDATGAIDGTLWSGGAGQHHCGWRYGCGAVFKLTRSASIY